MDPVKEAKVVSIVSSEHGRRDAGDVDESLMRGANRCDLHLHTKYTDRDIHRVEGSTRCASQLPPVSDLHWAITGKGWNLGERETTSYSLPSPPRTACQVRQRMNR